MSMIPSLDDSDLYADEAVFVPHSFLVPRDIDSSSGITPSMSDLTVISKEELADKLVPAFMEMVKISSHLVLKVVQKRLDRESQEPESQEEEEEEEEDDKIKTLVCRVEFEAKRNFGTRLIEIANPDDITLYQLKSYFFEQCMARHKLRNEGRYVHHICSDNDWSDDYTDKDGIPMYDGLKIIAWMPHEKNAGCIYLDLESEWKLFWQICRNNYDKWRHDNQIHFRAWLFKTAERMAYEKEVKQKQEEAEAKAASHGQALTGSGAESSEDGDNHKSVSMQGILDAIDATADMQDRILYELKHGYGPEEAHLHQPDFSDLDVD